VVWLKFNADPTLTRNLLNTGDSYLIESTTWHDNCWGICVKKDCVKCSGKLATNLLGKILMETRKKLKEQEDLIKEYNMNLGIETIGWA
jgi:predicted NAD-dependent protein-ADP-ribosyltransferase YbiA (DUF1768 family)